MIIGTEIREKLSKANPILVGSILIMNIKEFKKINHFLRRSTHISFF